MWADGKPPAPSERTNCLALSLDKEKPGLTAEPCDTLRNVGVICESTGTERRLYFSLNKMKIVHNFLR
jgi:hypothetical protein